MRVAPLPGRLLPGMQLYPPLTSQSLVASGDGLDPSLPQIGVVELAHLSGVAACTVTSQGVEVPVLLFFVGGRRRPFMVEATKIRTPDLTIGGSLHRPENLRRFIRELARRVPHLVVDSATYDFLQGRMLIARGERISDLSDAFGMILVQGQDQIQDLDAPGGVPVPQPAEAPSPQAPSPPAPPPQSTSSAGMWLHPQGRLVIVFAPDSVLWVGTTAEQAALCARRLRDGVDPRQVLGPRAAEIPKAAIRHVRRDRGAAAVELQYQTRDGLRKTSVPYGTDAAGQQLFASLRHHLGGNKP